MTNTEVVRALYDAFRTRDREALLALLDSDIVWEQNEGFPNGGRHVGAGVVLDEVLARFRTEWSAWSATPDEFLAVGDAVVVLGSYGGTHGTTGRSMTAAFAHVYRVQGGRIVQFQQFTDTLQVARAVGALASTE
jgi:uncharacterized protein